jgi:hypothetical protein
MEDERRRPRSHLVPLIIQACIIAGITSVGGLMALGDGAVKDGLILLLGGIGILAFFVLTFILRGRGGPPLS